MDFLLARLVIMSKEQKIDFGIVKKYFPDRGFGFIQSLSQPDAKKDLFFHIKTVKSTLPQIAVNLDNEDYSEEIFFWYQSEESQKGDVVSYVLSDKDIQETIFGQQPTFTETVRTIWFDIDHPLPCWIYDVTTDLVGIRQGNEWESHRVELEKKRDRLLEIERKKREREQQESNRAQENIMEREFEELVAEIKSHNFTYSSEVSRYIRRNNLGNKYKNISGIVKMKNNDDSWDFEGGFSPWIYARLCDELGLANRGSQAKVIGFKSFKDSKTPPLQL